MMTTTTLTLDTPEARRALARCVRLLLKWANEADETADGNTLAGEPSADIAPVLEGQDTKGIVADGE